MKVFLNRTLSVLVVYSVVLTALFYVPFVSEANANEYWSDWANSNQNGRIMGPIFTPDLVTALKGREQSGYGLINLSLGFDYNSDTMWTMPITFNQNGRSVDPIGCPPNTFVVAIEVREQSGYGLVDARLICSNSENTPWLTNNPNGRLQTIVTVNGTNGMTAREQSGYGIINLRMKLLKSRYRGH
jgi:hypothetical protein